MTRKSGFIKTHSLFLRNRTATNRITFLWNVTSCSPLERNNFREKPLPQTSNLKMEAACSIEASLHIYRTACRRLSQAINYETSCSITCPEFLD